MVVNTNIGVWLESLAEEIDAAEAEAERIVVSEAYFSGIEQMQSDVLAALPWYVTRRHQDRPRSVLLEATLGQAELFKQAWHAALPSVRESIRYVAMTAEPMHADV